MPPRPAFATAHRLRATLASRTIIEAKGSPDLQLVLTEVGERDMDHAPLLQQAGVGDDALHVEASWRRGAEMFAADVYVDGKGKRSHFWQHVGPHPQANILLLDPRASERDLGEAMSFVGSRGEESHRRFLDVIRSVFPDLLELRALRVGSEWIPHAVYATGAVPLASTGDGMQHLVQIAGALTGAEGVLVLSEEPEVFQHPAVLAQIAKVLWAAVDAGCQVIASTHSVDLIEHVRDLGRESSRKGRFGLIELMLAERSLSADISVNGDGPFRTQLLRERLGALTATSP